jgi:hypothetical protein
MPVKPFTRYTIHRITKKDPEISGVFTEFESFSFGETPPA